MSPKNLKKQLITYFNNQKPFVRPTDRERIDLIVAAVEESDPSKPIYGKSLLTLLKMIPQHLEGAQSITLKELAKIKESNPDSSQKQTSTKK